MPWAQVPTKALCVDRCGAACCRAPGSIVVTRDEAERIGRHSAHDTIFYQEGPDQHRLNFSDHEGRCPMLLWNSTCRIYEDRPQACRLFPTQPDPRCAVWPS